MTSQAAQAGVALVALGASGLAYWWYLGLSPAEKARADDLFKSYARLLFQKAVAELARHEMRAVRGHVRAAFKHN